MACSDGGKGRRSVSEEFHPSVGDVAVDSDVSKELGKDGLRVQAGCEEERSCSSVFLDEIRMRHTNLQEKCHSTVNISSHWRPLAKVTERQQHHLVAVRMCGTSSWYTRGLRAYPPAGQEHSDTGCVNTRLHSLGFW